MSAALSPTLRTCALNMLVHAKKVSCLSLLAELASAPLSCPRRIGSPTTIPFLSTGNTGILFPVFHPYIFVQISRRQNPMDTLALQRMTTSEFLSALLRPVVGRRTGRSSNSWYSNPYESHVPSLTLVFQGRGAFGSVVKARNKIDNRIYAGMWFEI